MTNTATISLTNAHGLFTAEVRTFERALKATAYRGDNLLRLQAAGHMGYTLDENCTFQAILDGTFSSPLDDCSRTEVLIAWIDSGNHTF